MDKSYTDQLRKLYKSLLEAEGLTQLALTRGDECPAQVTTDLYNKVLEIEGMARDIAIAAKPAQADEAPTADKAIAASAEFEQEQDSVEEPATAPVDNAAAEADADDKANEATKPDESSNDESEHDDVRLFSFPEDLFDESDNPFGQPEPEYDTESTTNISEARKLAEDSAHEPIDEIEVVVDENPTEEDVAVEPPISDQEDDAADSDDAPVMSFDDDNDSDSLFPESSTDQLKRMFTINDRYRFRRELFSNNDSDMADAINLLAAMRSYDEANDYILHDLGWDPEYPEVADFMKIVENFFTNRR